ncbi:N-acetyltransferase [Salinibius halmophilus]|uniref:N-acetyltransferase n=1 Tax=Salinibius halmophilus TaxID=1853216 RepID=UPI000E66E039|nr:N-acetyltransferase [Salinibius halmophilus]
MFQIRPVASSDIAKLLNIWLEASMQAHDFVEPEFWRTQLPNMRDEYLPASQVFVFEQDGVIYGFYALHEASLAALFVAPKEQGKGIGKALLEHAKSQRETLSLTVYKRNDSSYKFYLSQGFVVQNEQIDPQTGQVEYAMTLENTPTEEN